MLANKISITHPGFISVCLRLSDQAIIDWDRLRSHVYGRYDPVFSLWYMPWQDKVHVVKDINLDISVRTGK
jgi:hypothetical protein